MRSTFLIAVMLVLSLAVSGCSNSRAADQGTRKPAAGEMGDYSADADGSVSDEDAEKYIKIFTSLDKETIDALIKEHKKDPGMRVLQKRLAQEVTVLVHSQEALDAAIEASNILFGKSTKEGLEKLDEATFLDIFDGVPQEHIARTDLEAGIPIVDFMAVNTQIFPSKGEARKMTQANGVSVNKEKVTLDKVMTTADLIDGKYILMQKGKKNYYLVVVE